jgi:DNA-binding NarL/FixJ family response regulator
VTTLQSIDAVTTIRHRTKGPRALPALRGTRSARGYDAYREVDSVRVVVADDDTLLREGLVSLLAQRGFDVVGQVGNGVDLLAVVREQKPDLVLVEIRMPPTKTTDGFDAALAIRQEWPETAILVLSAYVDVECALQLLASGRRVGYLLKSRITDVADLIEALHQVAKGGSVVDPGLVQALVHQRRQHSDPLAALTQREHDVLELMAQGRSNAGIARRLWLAEGTVQKHIHHILNKLQLHGGSDDHRRVQAVITFLAARGGPRGTVDEDKLACSR